MKPNINKKKRREELAKQKRRVEARILRLEAGLPTEQSKSQLEQELQLVKAELKELKRPAQTPKPTLAAAKSNSKSSTKSSAKSTSKAKSPSKSKSTSKTKTTAPAKKSPLPGGASFPSFQLPSPKSATFADDSLKTIEGIRDFCKRCMGYMQRADQMIDGIHGMGNQLHQAGVLPKLFGGKFKDLDGNDWMAVLGALMNSPLASGLLGGGGAPEGGGDADEASAEKKQLEATEAKAEAEAKTETQQTKNKKKE